MRRQLLIGLQGSCKTTFLGGLWALLNAPTAALELQLHRLSGDRERLERLAACWLAGEEMERTKLQTEGWVELDLRPVAGGPVTRLALPDLSGESFGAQWRDRRAGGDYLAAANEADGILLFVHATAIRKSLSLTTMQAEARAIADVLGPNAGATPALDEGVTLGDTDPPHGRPATDTLGMSPTGLPPAPDDATAAGNTRSGNGQPSTDQVSAPVRYNPDDSPTQIQLVDLLQILQRPPCGPKRRRLAVILSAWDLVLAKLDRQPARYLREELPLLDQYLRANENLFEHRIYGVSPQGADKKDPSFGRRVSQLPEQRIIVDDGSSQGYDLTAILRWAGGDA